MLKVKLTTYKDSGKLYDYQEYDSKVKDIFDTKALKEETVEHCPSASHMAYTIHVENTESKGVWYHLERH